MASLVVNGDQVEVDQAPGAFLLWVRRERLKLTGTKYGCGTGPVWCLYGSHRR